VALHREMHRTNRVGWLRAAVLGANDGILSTASLILGIASAHGNHHAILVAGIAALTAGAMSMAVGEYVSVYSQADTEKADLARERKELETDNVREHEELAAIYVSRGLDPPLAKQVAAQLMSHDALQAHARDELGISEALAARPIQAALFSAASFAAGSVLPLLIALLVPLHLLIVAVSANSLLLLAFLGALAAYTGGARIFPGTLRVTLGGAFAMAATTGIGALFGVNP